MTIAFNICHSYFSLCIYVSKRLGILTYSCLKQSQRRIKNNLRVCLSLILRWLTGEMSQHLIFPLNVIIIFLYISSFQNVLNDLSIPCGCLFMVDNVRGGISKCIGKTKENKGAQTFKTAEN